MAIFELGLQVFEKLVESEYFLYLEQNKNYSIHIQFCCSDTRKSPIIIDQYDHGKHSPQIFDGYYCMFNMSHISDTDEHFKIVFYTLGQL